MAFEPQNELERSLVKATTEPAHRPQFYHDLAAADIFVIEQGAPPDEKGPRRLEAGEPLRLQHIEGEGGKVYLPVFSSVRRIQAVTEAEASYLRMNAAQLFEITAGADLLLNPGSDYGKELPASEVAAILDGSVAQAPEAYTVERDTQVQVGQPANYPEALAEALRSLFEKRDAVTRAWLAHFFNPERDEKPHTLLAIEVAADRGDAWERVAEAAGQVAQATPVPDPPVDLMQVASGKGGIHDYFLGGDTEPFYERSARS